MALLYGITGGIPLYLSLMDKKLSVEDNIKSSYSVAFTLGIYSFGVNFQFQKLNLENGIKKCYNDYRHKRHPK